MPQFLQSVKESHFFFFLRLGLVQRLRPQAQRFQSGTFEEGLDTCVLIKDPHSVAGHNSKKKQQRGSWVDEPQRSPISGEEPRLNRSRIAPLLPSLFLSTCSVLSPDKHLSSPPLTPSYHLERGRSHFCTGHLTVCYIHIHSFRGLPVYPAHN